MWFDKNLSRFTSNRVQYNSFPIRFIEWLVQSHEAVLEWKFFPYWTLHKIFTNIEIKEILIEFFNMLFSLFLFALKKLWRINFIAPVKSSRIDVGSKAFLSRSFNILFGKELNSNQKNIVKWRLFDFVSGFYMILEFHYRGNHS